jgi:hypothetical protein
MDCVESSAGVEQFTIGYCSYTLKPGHNPLTTLTPWLRPITTRPFMSSGSGVGSGERRSVPAAQRERFFGNFLKWFFLEINSVPAAGRERIFWNFFR